MIRTEIINRLEQKKCLPRDNGRITASSLAKLINPNSPSVFKSRFSQYRNGNIRELHFYEYYQICKALFDDYKEVFGRWCFHFESYENILNAFEFASTNRRFDITDHLLSYVDTLTYGKEIVSKLKEAAQIYTYVKTFQQRAKPTKEIRRSLRRFFPRYNIGQSLKTILECNALYNEFDFRSINRLIDDVRATVRDMKQYPYIKWSFKIRLFELLSQINLYAKFNTKLCRKYATIVIQSDIGRKFTADTYTIIGMSYLYENREKCLEYLGITYQMVLDDHRLELAENIKNTDVAFVNSYWGVYSATTDLSEQAHYEAKWGDKEKAKKLIDEAIEKYGESAYKVFYKAIAYDDVKLYSKAFALFLSMDNKFHARLVTERYHCYTLKNQMEEVLTAYKVY